MILQSQLLSACKGQPIGMMELERMDTKRLAFSFASLQILFRHNIDIDLMWSMNRTNTVTRLVAGNGEWHSWWNLFGTKHSLHNPTMRSNASITRVLLLLIGALLPLSVFSHGRISRHLILEDLSMVALIQDGTTTEGPFDEEESDYIVDPDMTLAAQAGADGISTDRTSVLDGIPLELTVRVYGIPDRSATVATELEGVEVFLWHCDAAGTYSAAESEGTEGQKWLRGVQSTDATGSASFRTILPGLYRGRMSHIHIRLRLPGETNYAATSQLYFSDEDVQTYHLLGIYADNTVPVTYSTTDGVYRSVNSQVAEMLTLAVQGDFDSVVSSEISLALVIPGLENPAPMMPIASPLAPATTASPAVPVGSPSTPSTGSPVASPAAAPVVAQSPSADNPTNASDARLVLIWANMFIAAVLGLSVIVL